MRNLLNKMSLNNRGMALVTVLMIMLVLSILTTGVVVIAVANYDQTSTTVEHSQAYYVAEAGVSYQVKRFETLTKYYVDHDYSTNEILDEVDNMILNDGDFENAFTSTGGMPGRVESTIRRQFNYIYITSVGTVGNVSRTLTKRIRMPGLIIDKAILTQGDLGINATDVFLGASGTYGPVQSLSAEEDSVTIDRLGHVSEVYIPTPEPPLTFVDVIDNCVMVGSLEDMTCQTGAYQYKVYYDDSVETLPPIVIPPIPNTTLKLQPFNFSGMNQLVTSSGNVLINSNTATNLTYNLAGANTPDTQFYVPSFRVEETVSGFKIDVGDKKIELVVDSLYLGGEFEIVGTGSLTVYVNFSGITLNCKNKVCGVKGNPDTPTVADKFILVVRGTEANTLDFTAGQNQSSMYLSLITNVSLDITLYGNGHFYGFIATTSHNITLNGTGSADPKSSLLLYAPFAAVTVNGSINMDGAIIADSYSSNGQAVMRFNPDFTSPPFDFLDPFASFQYEPTIEQ